MDSRTSRLGVGDEMKMTDCKCTFREHMVGDGCDICNPEMAKQIEIENGLDGIEPCGCSPFGLCDDHRPPPVVHKVIGVCVECSGPAYLEFENKKVCFPCAYNLANW